MITFYRPPKSGRVRAWFYDRYSRLVAIDIANDSEYCSLEINPSGKSIIITREQAGELGRTLVAFGATGELAGQEKEATT